MAEHLIILAVALLLDRIVGDPDSLWHRVPHPVVLFGYAIGLADRILNVDSDPPSVRRMRGVAAMAGLLVLSVLLAAVIGALLDPLGPFGLAVELILVAILLAQRSLADHVSAVVDGLKSGGLAGGREAISLIVGRDPESLDEHGICRAAIESLAENFSDGVVAPAFWYALFGLPGLFAYKMLNTADSMIGHKNARHGAFGWAAARLDDWANWPAARISAGLIAAASLITNGAGTARRSVGCALRDAGLHRSPNAGWPECAMAGALNLSLAGDRRYGGVVVREPRLNPAGRYRLNPQDITAALSLFWAACSALTLLVVLLFLITTTIS